MIRGAFRRGAALENVTFDWPLAACGSSLRAAWLKGCLSRSLDPRSRPPQLGAVGAALRAHNWRLGWGSWDSFADFFFTFDSRTLSFFSNLPLPLPLSVRPLLLGIHGINRAV